MQYVYKCLGTPRAVGWTDWDDYPLSSIAGTGGKIEEKVFDGSIGDDGEKVRGRRENEKWRRWNEKGRRGKGGREDGGRRMSERESKREEEKEGGRVREGKKKERE